MAGGRMLTRLGRAFEFGRHLPPHKLVRRIELDLKRRLRDLWPAPPRAFVAPHRAAHPPMPIMPPRSIFAAGADGAPVARFLGREWPLGPGSVDWAAPGAGAAHQLARMNLHYMEFLEGADDQTLASLCGQWIDANPQGRPGAWRDSWNSYALSLRVVVWLQQIALRRDRLPAAAVGRIETSAAAQVRFLEANIESDLGGNHIIKNIKALIWASAYFTGHDADRWRARGLALLSRELAVQVLADGMHDERSPSYHCQVFADLLECRHALGGDPLGGRLDQALAAMAQVTIDLTHPDGMSALFNDAGLTMSYAPSVCLDAYARLFGTRPAPRAVFALPAAGYFGSRIGGVYTVVDCGRIGPDDLPAHGHGDVLSFELSVGGQRFIVDQGVYEYVAGARRQASRSASQHNTLSIDGGDQADFFGAFRCGRRPNVEVRTWQPRADGYVLEGSHDGFARLPGRPVHVRRFDVGAAVIEITDRIEGRLARAAQIGFLLHPGVKVAIDDKRAVLRRDGTEVVVRSSQQLSVEGAVWWPDMGVEQTTHRLRVDVSPGATEIVTWLEPR